MGIDQNSPLLQARLLQARLLFGEERFDRYLSDTSDDVAQALELCRLNQHYAGLLHSQLGYVELAVRNSIDRQLQTLSLAETGTRDWTTEHKVPHLVNTLITRMLRQARAHASNDANLRTSRQSHRENNAVNHADVLSQLMWGTWVKLIGMPAHNARNNDQQELWRISTRLAFPNVSQDETGRMLVARQLEYLRTVRNNEAHYNTLYFEASQVNSIIGTCYALLNAIDCNLRQGWLKPKLLRSCAHNIRTLASNS
ncbi:MAG: hypothetical protein ABF805_09250 [Bifidobacterium sp.]